MSDWLHSLPVVEMAVVVFGLIYLVSAAIYVVVIALANAGWARAFKAVSPGILSPLGILCGLFIAFTAAQVWSDNDRASVAVNHEASALRAVIIFAADLPGDLRTRLHALLHRHIEDAVDREWPMMAKGTATLSISPRALAEAMQLTLALAPAGAGQQTAQRKIVSALESALDARRQRILISQSQVNAVKWSCLLLQAACVLLVIALIHSDSRAAAAIGIGLFATGVAVSVLLIAAYDRPFIGQLAIGPAPLLQIMPGLDAG